MIDQHFLSPPAPEAFGDLQSGERVLWHGRCGVAEYAFEQPESMPRWTLPESTEVVVTDRRVRYSLAAGPARQVRSGELRWLWPRHLRVQPGARSNHRGAASTQVQLVCGGDDGSFPALVLAGGDLATVTDADRVANVIRQAIARFRVDNARKLGLGPDKIRLLARLLMGPEFQNEQGGEGQTASLVGALLVSRPTPAPDPSPAVRTPEAPPAVRTPEAPRAVSTLEAPHALSTPEAPHALSTPEAPHALSTPEAPLAVSTPDPFQAESAPTASRRESTPGASHGESTSAAPRGESMPGPIPGERTRQITYRPGRAADAARALLAARAEQEAQQTEPEVAAHAADLASRVAEMVAARTDDTEPATPPDPRDTEPAQTPSVPAQRPGPPADASRMPTQRPADLPARARSDAPTPDLAEVPTTNLAARAARIRKVAARMAANSARSKASARRQNGASTRDRNS